jgi:translation initiation factor IF-2
MANDNPKTEQPKRASTEKEDQTNQAVERQPQARPQTPEQPARAAGQPGQGQPQAGQPQQGPRPANKPAENSQRNDANRQPKTPSFAKPSAPALTRPGESNPARPAGRPGGPGQGGDSDEVFNQRVFDPTSEDTVVPRGRPAPSGPRPAGGGGGYTGQNRGPAQGRPGGGGGGYAGGNQGGGGYGGQNRGPAQGRPSGGGGFGGNAPGSTPGAFGSPDRGGPQRTGPQQRPSGGTSGGNRPGGNQRRPQGKSRQAQLPPGERLAPPPLTGAARPGTAAQAAVTELVIGDTITIRDLAEKMRKSPIEVIKTLMNYGMMVTITESIDFDTAALIGEELGIAINREKAPEPETPAEPEAAPQTLRQRILAQEKAEDMEVRPPVVVVLGHVDHGKTTLLDAIRETRVVEGEAGGITQHIGAYQVKINGRKITFLDTPGHAAFTAMRARGAQVTDIAIVVVAADDGVMPQTKEAISHVKAAQVPIIVALNKIDKAQANPDRVKQELADNGLLIEEYGGDVMCVPVSAKMRRGIDDLLESILLLADVDPQTANPNGDSVGTVIESRLDKQRGPMATLLVQNGTLRVSDSIVSGETYAKIRAMYNDKGEPITEAKPATPVQILGFSDVPVAGETFRVVADDRTARALASERQLAKKAAAGPAPARTLESIFAAAEAGQVKELNLILKADVQGSIEPIVNSLEKLSTDKLKVKILHQGTGNISESDIMLAVASHAIVIGFSVVADGGAQKMAEAEGVDIRIYNIIYNIIEDVQKALQGMLEPVYKEVVTGHAEIRQVFKVSKVGKVAGCYIIDGEIQRNSPVRVKRAGESIAEDKIAALKRFQEDVPEVKTGFECGIHLHNFHDFETGDILEAYKKERVL